MKTNQIGMSFDNQPQVGNLKHSYPNLHGRREKGKGKGENGCVCEERRKGKGSVTLPPITLCVFACTHFPLICTSLFLALAMQAICILPDIELNT